MFRMIGYRYYEKKINSVSEIATIIYHNHISSNCVYEPLGDVSSVAIPLCAIPDPEKEAWN